MNRVFKLWALMAAVVCCTPLIAQRPVKSTATTKPFVLGVVEEIQSLKLSERRVLNIYLPEGYGQQDTTRYPVVYLLDGSADEDFIHIAGLYQFNSFPWIQRVPRSIVVGIASVDRIRDFTYPTTIGKDARRFQTSGKSANFIAFLEEELQPFIQSKYRVNSSRTIIGQSLGGLLATEILFTRPALFNRYIIVSPSLWWDNGSLLQKAPAVLSPASTDSLQVYIGVGKEGLVPGDNPRVMEVDANLLADKIAVGKNRNIQLFFDYLPAEDHATILHQAVLNALKSLHGVNGAKQ